MLFAALLGAILILIVGGLWRRSKLAGHAEVSAAQYHEGQPVNDRSRVAARSIDRL
jgi:hypothetical protein